MASKTLRRAHSAPPRNRTQRSHNSMLAKIAEYEDVLDEKFRIAMDAANTKPLYLLRISQFLQVANEGSREDNEILDKVAKGLASHITGISEEADSDEKSAIIIEHVQLIFNIMMLHGDWKAKVVLSKFSEYARSANPKVYNKFFSKKVLHEELEKNRVLIDYLVGRTPNMNGGGKQSGGAYGLRIAGLVALILDSSRVAQLAQGTASPLSETFVIPAWITAWFSAPDVITETEGFPAGLGSPGMLAPLDSNPAMKAGTELEAELVNATALQDDAYSLKIRMEATLGTHLAGLHLRASNPASVEAGILDICPELRESAERTAARQKILNSQRSLANLERRHTAAKAKENSWLWNKPTKAEQALIANYSATVGSLTTELQVAQAIIGNSTHLACTSPTTFFGDAEQGIESSGAKIGELLAITIASAAEQGVLLPALATAESGIFPALAAYGKEIQGQLSRRVETLSGQVAKLTPKLAASKAAYDTAAAGLKLLTDAIDAKRAERASLSDRLIAATAGLAADLAAEARAKADLAAPRNSGLVPSLREAVRVATAAVAARNATIASLPGQIAAIDAELPGLLSQASPVHAEVANLKYTMDTFNSTLTTRVREVEQARNETSIAFAALSGPLDVPAIGGPEGQGLLLGNSANAWELVPANNGGQVVRYKPAVAKRPNTSAMPKGSLARVALNGALVSSTATVPSIMIGPPGHQISVSVPRGKRISGSPVQIAYDLYVLGNLTALRDHVVNMVEDPKAVNWAYIESNIRKNLIHELFVQMLGDQRLLGAPANAKANSMVKPTSDITKLTIEYALSLAADQFYSLSTSRVDTLRSLTYTTRATDAQAARDKMVGAISLVYNSRFNNPNASDGSQNEDLTYMGLVDIAIKWELGRIVTDIGMVPTPAAYRIIAQAAYNTVRRHYDKEFVPRLSKQDTRISRDALDVLLLRSSNWKTRTAHFASTLWLDILVFATLSFGIVLAGTTIDALYGRVIGFLERGNRIAELRTEAEMARIRHQMHAERNEMEAAAYAAAARRRELALAAPAAVAAPAAAVAAPLAALPAAPAVVARAPTPPAARAPTPPAARAPTPPAARAPTPPAAPPAVPARPVRPPPPAPGGAAPPPRTSSPGRPATPGGRRTRYKYQRRRKTRRNRK